ncbi:MAG TPA: spore coat protein U domain-containing protein [Gallionella sp.]
MKMPQMKKLAASTISAATLLAAAPAHAATVTQTFDVSVHLSAACQVVTTPLALDFGAYTAFGGATNAAPTTSMSVECTRGLAAPTYTFDGATGYGVLAGLNYNVTAVGVVSAGSPATATVGGVGSGDLYTITLTGAMAAGQAGACATAGSAAAACDAAPQIVTRTLTVTY